MDNIRAPQEIQDALRLIYDTDVEQLAGVVRSGPNSGRRKLLLALAMAAEPTLRVVREEPPQDASSASPAPLVPESESGTSTTAPSATSAPALSGSEAKDPAPTLPKEQLEAQQRAPTTFQVADPAPTPTLPDTTTPVATRQVVCCRARCMVLGCNALCGYSSEVPNDTHFAPLAGVRHHCKQHFRARLENRGTQGTLHSGGQDDQQTWSQDDQWSDWDHDDWGWGSWSWRW